MAVDYKIYPIWGPHIVEVIRIELLEIFGRGAQIEKCSLSEAVACWIQ